MSRLFHSMVAKFLDWGKCRNKSGALDPACKFRRQMQFPNGTDRPGRARRAASWEPGRGLQMGYGCASPSTFALLTYSWNDALIISRLRKLAIGLVNLVSVNWLCQLILGKLALSSNLSPTPLSWNISEKSKTFWRTIFRCSNWIGDPYKKSTKNQQKSTFQQHFANASSTECQLLFNINKK